MTLGRTEIWGERVGWLGAFVDRPAYSRGSVGESVWQPGQACVCSARGTAYAVGRCDAKVEVCSRAHLDVGWSGAAP